MIDLNKSRLVETYVAALHSSVSLMEEGKALVKAWEGGVEKLRPATGAAGERFAGVSIGRATTPTNVPFFETVPVGAAGGIKLSKMRQGTDLSVVHVAPDGTRTKLAAGDPATTDTYSIDGDTLTLPDARDEGTVELGYNYNISLAEAMMKYNLNTGIPADSLNLGTVGTLTTGWIYTSCYDITADWGSYDGTQEVKLTSDGRFTLGGTGGETSCTVREIPSASGNGMLGLTVNL